MRVIKITSGIISEVKYLSDDYNLKENEFFSESGELGQQKLLDGTFVNVDQEVVVSEPTIEEKILFEMQYQTTLLEMNNPI